LKTLVSVIGLLAMAILAGSQSLDGDTTTPEKKPRRLPAMIGEGPESLKEKIDYPQSALKSGTNALVTFSCDVERNGKASWVAIDRATPDSEDFIRVARDALKACRFQPARVDGKPVKVWVTGAIVFRIRDGKPLIHLYLSSDDENLKAGRNHITPQLIGGWSSFANRIHYPKSALNNRAEGEVTVSLDVDSEGNPTRIGEITATPPDQGFAASVRRALSTAEFIPAYQDGRPVAASLLLPVSFQLRE
jgi:TonB family protein